MKALTICQPYAHLIMTGQKLVENRTWPTRHRGLLYIHAGKSPRWLDGHAPEDTNMAFGAVVAIANLVDCLRIGDIELGEHDDKYPWLRTHEHANGPWCWILDNVVPIGPWPYRGAQGLFDIKELALDAIANKELGISDCEETSRSNEVPERSRTIASGTEATNTKEGARE